MGFLAFLLGNYFQDLVTIFPYAEHETRIVEAPTIIIGGAGNPVRRISIPKP